MSQSPIGYNYLVCIKGRVIGDLGGMQARGSRTGTKCAGGPRQTVLFHQVNLAYQPLNKAA